MRILAIILVLTLVSCARVTVKAPGGWDITYQTFFRQVEGVEASVDDVKFSLGKASSEVEVNNEIVACMLAPQLCK